MLFAANPKKNPSAPDQKSMTTIIEIRVTVLLVQYNVLYVVVKHAVIYCRPLTGLPDDNAGQWGSRLFKGGRPNTHASQIAFFPILSTTSQALPLADRCPRGIPELKGIA